MGPELDAEGWVKNPTRCNWKTGGVFVTPPGWYFFSFSLSASMHVYFSQLYPFIFF